jgi:hypothetical protein
MKFIYLMMLGLSGITATLCAQQFRKDVGNLPDSIDRRFYIDLGKGNRLKIELSDISDLDHFNNIDSLLLIFTNDIKPLHDSLSDPLSAKRVEYLVDDAGLKKILILETRPQGSGFVIDREGLAALRLAQDTIIITVVKLHIRLSFYLNQWNELENYVTSGLNDKLRLLRNTRRINWSLSYLDKNRHVYLAADKTISADQMEGYTLRRRDYLASVIQVNVQNYQNYFVPSFSLGLRMHVSNNIFHPNGRGLGQPDHDLGFTWDPLFLFAPDAQGHMQTYRNDFLTLSYKLAKRDEKDPLRPHITVNPGFAFSWLVYRQGDYFEKNSFRLGIGSANIWGGAATLQPCLFFHDLFRGVTPGLKLSIDF